MISPHPTQRGIALIEALVAILVVGLVMLAAARWQQQLRALADTSRERSEAVRLADAAIERARGFLRIESRGSGDSFAELDARTVSSEGTASNARFSLERTLAASVDGARELAVRVSWADRGGATHALELATVVAGHDPRLPAAWMRAQASLPPRGALARHAAIPFAARDLGDGRSAFTPAPGAAPWIFDNLTGMLQTSCVSVTSRCDGPRFLLLRGTIRFDASDTPDPATAGDAPLPLSVTLADTTAPEPTVCATEPVDAGERFVRFHCAVAPDVQGAWAGRILLVPNGWALGSGSSERRVCRYAAVAEERATGIREALTHQDFLVVRGDVACPAAILGADPSHVDRSTLAHQP